MLSVPDYFGPFSAPYAMLCPAPPPAQIIPLELLWLMPTLSFVASSLDHSDLLRLTGQGWQGMAVQVGQRRTKKVGLGRQIVAAPRHEVPSRFGDFDGKSSAFCRE